MKHKKEKMIIKHLLSKTKINIDSKIETNLEKYQLFNNNEFLRRKGHPNIALRINNTYIFCDSYIYSENKIDEGIFLNNLLNSAYFVISDGLSYCEFLKLGIIEKKRIIKLKMNIISDEINLYFAIQEYFSKNNIEFIYQVIVSFPKNIDDINIELHTIDQIIKNRLIPIDNFEYIVKDEIKNISILKIKNLIEGIYFDPKNLKYFKTKSESDKDLLVSLISNISVFDDLQLLEFLNITVGYEKAIEVLEIIDSPDKSLKACFALHFYLLNILDNKSIYNLDYTNISSSQATNLSSLNRLFHTDIIYLHPQDNLLNNTIAILNKNFVHLEQIHLKNIDYLILNKVYNILSKLDLKKNNYLSKLTISQFSSFNKFIHCNTYILIVKMYIIMEKYRKNCDREYFVNQFLDNNKYYLTNENEVSNDFYQFLFENNEYKKDIISKEHIKIFLNSQNKNNFFSNSMNLSPVEYEQILELMILNLYKI